MQQGIKKLQWLEYLKVVFLEILNPLLCRVFANQVTYHPDGVVLRKFQGWDLPIFILEVRTRTPYHTQKQICLSSYDYCSTSALTILIYNQRVGRVYFLKTSN